MKGVGDFEIGRMTNGNGSTVTSSATGSRGADQWEALAHLERFPQMGATRRGGRRRGNALDGKSKEGDASESEIPEARLMERDRPKD